MSRYPLDGGVDATSSMITSSASASDEQFRSTQSPAGAYRQPPGCSREPADPAAPRLREQHAHLFPVVPPPSARERHLFGHAGRGARPGVAQRTSSAGPERDSIDIAHRAATPQRGDAASCAAIALAIRSARRVLHRRSSRPASLGVEVAVGRVPGRMRMAPGVRPRRSKRSRWSVSPDRFPSKPICVAPSRGVWGEIGRMRIRDRCNPFAVGKSPQRDP